MHYNNIHDVNMAQENLFCLVFYFLTKLQIRTFKIWCLLTMSYKIFVILMRNLNVILYFEKDFSVHIH